MKAGKYFIKYKKDNAVMWNNFGGGETITERNIYNWFENAVYACNELKVHGYKAKVIDLQSSAKTEVYWNY